MLDRVTPPEVKPFGHLTLPDMERVTLDNGIVLNIYDHSFQDVSELSLLLPGGIVDAKGSMVAQMLTQVMLDGSRKYPGSALSDALDFNGAKVTPSITDHHTTMSLRLLNSHWAQLLPVFADMIFAPEFSQRAIDTCKQRAAQGLEIAMQRVETKVQKVFRELCYGESHPKAHIDTPDDINATTREDFTAWHSQVFRQNLAAAELFLSGRVTQEMIADVNRVFGSIKLDDAMPASPYIVPAAPTAPANRFVESPGALQSAIRVGIPSIPRSHPDYIMLRCAVVALGGYFGSRLMANIREDKGYTYGIQAGLLGSPEGTLMAILTSADNSYVDAVLTEIRTEIERLYTGDFSDDEMERLRNYLMTSLAQQLDTAFSIASYHITERVSFTGRDYFSRQFNVISAMTAESLAEVARKHLPIDQMIVAVAGKKPAIC
jgi:predicted Zn-dependent peptidase